MPDVRDMYQQLILEHSKSPRNFRQLDHASRQAQGFNPLCGDRYTVYLAMEGDIIKDISFLGSGCAISKASASMMTQVLKGKTRREAEALFESFRQTVTGKRTANGDPADLGKLSVFAGVSEYPVRVKCVTLAWHTLRAALGGAGETVSTE